MSILPFICVGLIALVAVCIYVWFWFRVPCPLCGSSSHRVPMPRTDKVRHCCNREKCRHRWWTTS